MREFLLGAIRLLLVHEGVSLGCHSTARSSIRLSLQHPKNYDPLVQPFNANRTNSSEHNKPHLPTPHIPTTQQTHDQLWS